MKNNIKKIILEEINDFDWTDEVDDSGLYVGMCLLRPKGPNHASPTKYEVINISGDLVTLKWSVSDRHKPHVRPILNVIKDIESGELSKCDSGLNENFDWADDISPYTAMPSETEEPQRTVYASSYDEENHRIMNYIFDEGYHYNGWRIVMDKFSGVVEWDREGQEYMIYATPHYDDENVTPVAIENDEEYVAMFDVKVPKFDFVEEAEKWYKEDYPKLVIDSVKRSGYAWLVR